MIHTVAVALHIVVLPEIAPRNLMIGPLEGWLSPRRGETGTSQVLVCKIPYFVSTCNSFRFVFLGLQDHIGDCDLSIAEGITLVGVIDARVYAPFCCTKHGPSGIL